MTRCIRGILIWLAVSNGIVGRRWSRECKWKVIDNEEGGRPRRVRMRGVRVRRISLKARSTRQAANPKVYSTIYRRLRVRMCYSPTVCPLSIMHLYVFLSNARFGIAGTLEEFTNTLGKCPLINSLGKKRKENTTDRRTRETGKKTGKK